MSDQPAQSVPPSAQMFQVIFSVLIPQAIYVAAKLGIADIVAREEPATLAQVASETGSDAPSLRRLLKFLASAGIFAEDASGRYRHTPMSGTLRSDHPQSVREMAILFGSPAMWKPIGELSATIADGKPAFDQVFGASFFEYMSGHPGDAAVFNAAMTSISSIELPLIVAA